MCFPNINNIISVTNIRHKLRQGLHNFRYMELSVAKQHTDSFGIISAWSSSRWFTPTVSRLLAPQENTVTNILIAKIEISIRPVAKVSFLLILSTVVWTEIIKVTWASKYRPYWNHIWIIRSVYKSRVALITTCQINIWYPLRSSISLGFLFGQTENKIEHISD